MMTDKKIFLLVDDDVDDRDLFTEALGRIDASTVCYTAVNGLKAVELLTDLNADRPDVIFLDINMPAMNGWQCLKWIRENEAFRNIPVIMYSTSAHQRDRDIASDMGAVYFFPKPERFDMLCNFLSFVSDKLSLDLKTELINYDQNRLLNSFNGN